MKNLDTSIANQSILDESFSNFTSNDVLDLRTKIKEAEARLDFLNHAPRVPEYILQAKQVSTNLASLKSQLAAIPKSVIDAVDKNIQLQSDLSKSEADKNQAAEIAAIDKQNQAIQAAIDKSKGVTEILSGKIEIPTPAVQSIPSESKVEQNTSVFTTKNIVIAVSLLGLSVGGYFLVKHFIK